jgi:hypothetical protein
MVASPNEFIDVVARARDLIATQSTEHFVRLEPRASALAWHCDLDDGTPTSNENDPAAFVRWVCPALRVVGAQATTAGRLNVRRLGPRSDLGRLIGRLGRLGGRPAGRSSDDGVKERFAYTDPDGVLDASLRQRIEHWPEAMHGNGKVQPAELWSIKVNREGLIVASVSWWGSAAALDHQIALALDLADRLTASA